MNIRREITVTYEELLALGTEYVADVERHQTVSTKAPNGVIQIKD